MVWEWRNGQRVRITALVTNHAALAAAIHERGVNVTARQVGCSGATVSLIASGKQPSCTVALATRLAKALGVDREAFFTIETVSQATRHVRTEPTPDRKTA